jgi:hypothetical protein
MYLKKPVKQGFISKNQARMDDFFHPYFLLKKALEKNKNSSYAIFTVPFRRNCERW